MTHTFTLVFNRRMRFVWLISLILLSACQGDGSKAESVPVQLVLHHAPEGRGSSGDNALKPNHFVPAPLSVVSIDGEVTGPQMDPIPLTATAQLSNTASTTLARLYNAL